MIASLVVQLHCTNSTSHCQSSPLRCTAESNPMRIQSRDTAPVVTYMLDVLTGRLVAASGFERRSA